MNVIEKTLADALTHVDVMPGLAGEIRDAFAGARKDLEGIRDEAKAFAESVVAKARGGLDAFKGEVTAVEGKIGLPDPITAGASVPVTTDDGYPSAQASASESDPAASSVTVNPGVTDAIPPVSVMTPSGAMATVDPVVGATTHEDDAGTTTVVDHATGAATATDASGNSVNPTPAAVAEAVQATTDAGVTVPAPEAAAQPVI